MEIFLDSPFTEIQILKSSSCCLYPISLLAMYLLIKSLSALISPQNYPLLFHLYKIKVKRVHLNDSALKSMYFNPV